MCIILTADIPKNANDTSGPVDPANYNAAANPQAMSTLPQANVETNLHLITVPSNEDNSMEPPNQTSPTITLTKLLSTPPRPTPSTTPSTTLPPETTTTSTTPVPTTTAAPTTPAPTTPLPPPSPGKWIVQENNTLCIIVKMAVQLNVSYTNADNKVSTQKLSLQYYM